MTPAENQKNQLFSDYAAVCKALLPGSIGFAFHDHRGRLFWADSGINSAHTDDVYLYSLRQVLEHQDIPDEHASMELSYNTAFIFRLTNSAGIVLGAASAFVNHQMGVIPYEACRDKLGPALRSLSSELGLRLQLFSGAGSGDSGAADRPAEENFLRLLNHKARAKKLWEDTLRDIIELALDHLELDGAVFVHPERGIRIVAGAQPVSTTEAEFAFEALQDIAATSPDNVAEALTNRGQPDPKAVSRSWPILEDDSRLAAALILSRPASSQQFSDHAAAMAGFVAATIEHVIERSFDPLTGLLNWSGFDARLQEACAADAPKATVMYMDIDQLHVVNDTFGRETGDAVLQSFAGILRRLLPGQLVTRMSGGSFAALLDNISLDQVEQAAGEICREIRNVDYASGDKTIRPTASIGIAVVAQSDPDAGGPMVSAQIACQAAKDRGRGRYELYQQSDASIVRRMDELSLVGSIRSAIEGGRMVLVGQPIVRLDDPGRMDHYEILVRMLDSAGKELAPAEFLGAAERYQLMQDLDRWVVSKAIDTLVEARTDVAGNPLNFAINLSGQSLGNEQFLGFIRDELNRTGVSPRQLCFEITETVAVANLKKAQMFMNELQTIGCRFALDDFGTGLSSFGYLKLFPVDKLKIDGSFIKDIVDNEVSRAMVSAISEIARVMHMETVAEYVQDEASMLLLRKLGVTWAQGFHVGVPNRLNHLFGEGTIMDMRALVDRDGSLTTETV